MSLLPASHGPDWLNQASRLTALRNLGFAPTAILDIGAYHGWWCGLAAHIWPFATTLSIEANEDCRDELTKRGRPFEIALLDSQAREVDYHKCTTGCGEGNGLFKENSIHPFVAFKQQTRTLDDVAAGRTFDFVKLDCQGAELSIICGGEQTINRATVIQLETQVQDYNEGAPRVADILTAMSLRGFRVFDIVDFHYNSRGMLLQVDLLFVRRDSPLFTIRPLS